ncbi:unnamed protein product [Oikopleura dioica]|uniref:Uncharacterized protein n=1 Tax=Oikopleura dioica TaxID=34765 RepID=E4Y5X5_OIKDI|nr:unnamed protein product [Oikopleura dioica]
MRFWKATFLSVCLSENKFTHRDPGEPCLKGVTVQNMPGWEGNYFLDGKSDNGHPVYQKETDWWLFEINEWKDYGTVLTELE